MLDVPPLARELGAAHYVDRVATDPAAELKKLGGAKVVLATVTAGSAMAAVVSGLGVDAKLLIVGAADSFEISPLALIGCSGAPLERRPARRYGAGRYSNQSKSAGDVAGRPRPVA
jgi:NADPH:quinone reductase-like Zn-dependent oxidoreductase